MKVRRTCKLLVEPPSSATGDIAFNLIVFFLVCINQPDSGRPQEYLSEENQEQKEEVENIEITVRLVT